MKLSIDINIGNFGFKKTKNELEIIDKEGNRRAFANQDEMYDSLRHEWDKINPYLELKGQKKKEVQAARNQVEAAMSTEEPQSPGLEKLREAIIKHANDKPGERIIEPEKTKAREIPITHDNITLGEFTKRLNERGSLGAKETEEPTAEIENQMPADDSEEIRTSAETPEDEQEKPEESSRTESVKADADENVSADDAEEETVRQSLDQGYETPADRVAKTLSNKIEIGR
jgi:hypothetical protein